MANEKRLINANALKIEFKMREMADIDMYGGCHIAECFQGYEANAIVDKMPTVDAVEVVHGRWVKHNNGFGYLPLYECSVCGKYWDDDMNFCGECGAKMDGERRTDNA